MGGVAPEPGGFWTRGDSSSRLAVALAPNRPKRRSALRTRPPPVDGKGHRDGDIQNIALAALAQRDITLRSPRAVTTVEIVAEGSFVPAPRWMPTRGTARPLSVWVEVTSGRRAQPFRRRWRRRTWPAAEVARVRAQRPARSSPR